MRLGIYVDQRYSKVDGKLTSDQPVIKFLAGLSELGVSVTMFGRLEDSDGIGPHPYELSDRVRLVPLPSYPALDDVSAVVSAARHSIARFRAALSDLDCVWLFGPHPFAIAFATVAKATGTPAFLGVRQDFPSYIARRADGRRWAVPLARAMESAFRLMARRLPTVVVGNDLALKYSTGHNAVLETGFSLIREGEVVGESEALATDWNGGIEILSVGRLDPEKNPLLLLETMHLLTRQAGSQGSSASDEALKVSGADRRWRLTVAGDGPLKDALAARIRELNLDDSVRLLGQVPNGPELHALYSQSHVFLHVSYTEGLPQVLFEAHARGLPIVATAVGGVAQALGGGETGLLMPADDAECAARHLTQLAENPSLRRKLIVAGLQTAHANTFEAQGERIIEFLNRYR